MESLQRTVYDESGDLIYAFQKNWFTHYVTNICENYSDLHPLYIFTDKNLNCNCGIRICVALTLVDMLATAEMLLSCVWEVQVSKFVSGIKTPT